MQDLEYSGIANACSSIFAVLELVYHINHAYRFSLQYFVDIFHHVLYDNMKLKSVADYPARSDIILKDIFIETFQRTSISMYQKDKITLAMLLVRASPYDFDRSLLDLILPSPNPEDSKDVIESITTLPPFHGQTINANDSAWQEFVTSERAERHVPKLWSDDLNIIDQGLLRLLLVKTVRPDRFLPAAEQLVSIVFGPEMFQGSDSLAVIVKQVTAGTPVALMSNSGFDASYKVDALVDRHNAVCANVAMGSEEGVASANRAISSATANGTWVLIKNVHLAPQWLQSLEKRLSTLKPHDDFRLFLSMETSSKIPVNLIRAARTLVYEQLAGIRANMKDTLSVLADRGAKAPAEKGRLYLLLCFFHAVLQERLRYAPTLGWKGLWEFNDSDYECCAFIIDSWIEHVAQGRSNIPPVKLPWELLRTMITEMYGGKIDDEGDFNLLNDLVKQVFDPAAYEDEHELVSEADGKGLKVPSGTSMADFTMWVDALPEREPPSYLGLPANAEKLLLVGQGEETVRSLGRIVDLLEEGEQVIQDNSAQE